MSKGKRLVLALVLLVTFCTVAIAASPKVDSILQEHDVLVPFFLPRTLFTITPQGDDVTWSISRKNGDEWEDATVSWDQSTPLQGEIGADDGQQRIWWNFKNYGDNTGHDGGRLTPRRIESPFTFGKPFRISDYFSDDRVALLYVNNLMSFSTANPYVTRFGMNKPENQDTLNAMKALMNHAL